jgi:hypothetical protein
MFFGKKFLRSPRVGLPNLFLVMTSDVTSQVSELWLLDHD